jgi:hypothetical protein
MSESDGSTSKGNAASAFATIQRKLCTRPSQPLIAYIVKPAVFLSVHWIPLQTRVIVQHTFTRQVVWMQPWVEVKLLVFGVTDSITLVSALQALWNDVALDSYDPATLIWSGMRNWTTMSIPVTANNSAPSGMTFSSSCTVNGNLWRRASISFWPPLKFCPNDFSFKFPCNHPCDGTCRVNPWPPHLLLPTW